MPLDQPPPDVSPLSTAVSVALQIWGGVGASIMLLLMAVVKRKWRRGDSRQLGNQDLRVVADVYREAYLRQQGFLDTLKAEWVLAQEKKLSGETAKFEYGLERIDKMIVSPHNFLEEARHHLKAQIDIAKDLRDNPEAEDDGDSLAQT